MKEEELRSFIQEAPVAAAMFDREMRYVAVSDRWLNERGINRSIIGRGAYEVYPDITEEWRQIHRRALAGEIISRREGRLATAQGEVEWVRYQVRPWRDAKSEIGGIVVFAEDVTPQKSAEKALQESERRYRYAIEASSDGIWDWDLQTDVAYVSPSFYEMLGFGETDLTSDVSSLWIGLLTPEEGAKAWATARELLQSQGRCEIEFQILKKDGSRRWCLSRGKVVERDALGAPARAVGTFTDITGKNIAELAARESEQRFQRMAHTAPVLIWMSGVDKACTYFNQPWLDFTGRKLDEELGHGWGQGVHADDFGARSKTYCECFARRQKFEMEYRLRRHDGVYRWILDRGAPRFADSGEFLGYIGSCIDITDRRELEINLRANEARFVLAQSAGQIGIWEWDLSENSAFVNTAWREIFGVSSERPISHEDLLSLVVPEDRGRYGRSMREALRCGGVFESEIRITRACDRTSRWVKARGQVTLDEEGRAVRAMEVVFDITELKDAQALLLKRSEDQFQRVLEASQEGVWVIDRGGLTTVVNPQMAQMLGYAPEQMLGRAFTDFVDDEWRRIAQEIMKTRPEGAAARRDFCFQRKDGSRLWVLLSMHPIIEEGNYVGALAMVMDFTERKKLEEDRRLYLEELKAADGRKDFIIAFLSHELRNPLATIESALQLLQLPGGDKRAAPAENRTALRSADRQVKHLKHVVSDLLEIIQISHQKTLLRVEKLCLNDLIKKSSAVWTLPIRRKKQILKSNICDEPLYVSGDPSQLIQVISSIVDNASRHTEPGGLIELSVDRRGGDAVVNIRDNGLGIPPGMLSSIFEPFAQIHFPAQRSREGIGIGLALAKKIIELHGGAIEADSKGAGCGSEFSVSLPLVDSETRIENSRRRA